MVSGSVTLGVVAVVVEAVVVMVVCCVTGAFALDEPPFEPQEASVKAHITAAKAAASLCILYSFNYEHHLS